MFDQDFSMFSRDPVLTSLCDISTAKLHSELGRCVPPAMLDAPLESYRVSNLRYSPRRKLTIGLTSAAGMKPISLRVFPRESLENRITKARRRHPASTFLLEGISAVAWVFPGERKLNLDQLSDRSALSDLLYSQRGYRLTQLELMHFVPEHTYTARVHGERDDASSVCEYLKIYYNDDGAITADLMRQLADQVRDSVITIPDDLSYFPEQRMLVQSALLRDESRKLGLAAVASALACFHGLSASAAHESFDDPDAETDATLALVSETFPSCSSDVRDVSLAIRIALRANPESENVLLHGDAHLGNLFPMPDGRVGVIDLDRVRLGAPEDDLASFVAYKIWLNLRDRLDGFELLEQFPLFLRAYNDEARVPVSICRAYQVLAQKMITERIWRGIRRGKINEPGRLIELTRIAAACLAAAERYHD